MSPSGPDAELGVFFVVGLLGGAHCLGMCGPLVTLYADRLGGEDDRLAWPEVRQHLLFNLGRTAGYALAGLVLGGLGAVLFDAAAVVAVADGVRAVAGLLVGGFILVTGAGYLLRGTSPAGHSLPFVGDLFGRVTAVVHRHVDEWAEGPRIAVLGGVHTLLPCPLLYPAFLFVLARGTPVRGAVLLGALGLGTVPTLLAYGTLVGSVSTAHRVRLHRALGAAFLVLGYLPLSHGLELLGVGVPHLHVPIYQPLG